MQNSNSNDGTNVPTSRNADVISSSQTIAKPNVGSSVFVVVRKLDLLILGCFNERFKAEKWAAEIWSNGSVGLAIQELTVS